MRRQRAATQRAIYTYIHTILIYILTLYIYIYIKGGTDHDEQVVGIMSTNFTVLGHVGRDCFVEI